MRNTFVRVWALPFAGVAVVIALVWATTIRGPLLPLEGGAASWGTLTMGIVVQALPFLVLGVVGAGLSASAVPRCRNLNSPASLTAWGSTTPPTGESKNTPKA